MNLSIKSIETSTDAFPTIGRILGAVLWVWGWVLSSGGWAWLAFFLPVYAWYVSVMHILGHLGIT